MGGMYSCHGLDRLGHQTGSPGCEAVSLGDDVDNVLGLSKL